MSGVDGPFPIDGVFLFQETYRRIRITCYHNAFLVKPQRQFGVFPLKRQQGFVQRIFPSHVATHDKIRTTNIHVSVHFGSIRESIRQQTMMFEIGVDFPRVSDIKIIIPVVFVGEQCIIAVSTPVHVFNRRYTPIVPIPSSFVYGVGIGFRQKPQESGIPVPVQTNIIV